MDYTYCAISGNEPSSVVLYRNVGGSSEGFMKKNSSRSHPIPFFLSTIPSNSKRRIHFTAEIDQRLLTGDVIFVSNVK